MKNTLTLHFLLCLLFIGASFQVQGQCTDYANPQNTLAFNDFNRIFFGAPCDDGSGCSFNEIQEFQVFAAEAYRVNFFRKGGVYSFSMCNGPDAGSWIPEFTIQAPSGAIDAFGSGDGDSCTITWTASEDGEYLIIINEKDQCGGGENLATANGYPAITCLSGAPCPEVDSLSCYEWQSHAGPRGYTNFAEEFGGAPCDSGSGCETFTLDIEAWASEAYTMPNIQEGAEYAFDICSGPGAGSWVPTFTIIAPNGEVDAFGPGDGDSCTISWQASTSGVYLIVISELDSCNGTSNLETNNGFPSITCLSGTFCEEVMCSAGSTVSERSWVVCGDTDSFAIQIDDAVIPEGGGIGYGFAPGPNGTGGNGTGFAITNSSTNVVFDSDINGILSSNNLEVLRGTWIISPFTYTDTENAVNSRCDVSSETITVLFNENLEANAAEIGSGQAVVNYSGGTAPYTVLWSGPEGQTSDTLTITESGDYMVTVTDDLGCEAISTITLTISSTDNLNQVEDWIVSPNPTNGSLTVQLNLSSDQEVQLDLIDLTGRVLDRQKWMTKSKTMSYDLSAYAPGMYLLNLNLNGEQKTQKIMLIR